MAKKEVIDKKAKKATKVKKVTKALKDKKYFAVKACGKKFSLKGPVVWEKLWKEIALAAHPGDETLFSADYICDKCSRLSPTKSYLCKPKKIKS